MSAPGVAAGAVFVTGAGAAFTTGAGVFEAELLVSSGAGAAGFVQAETATKAKELTTND